MIKYSLPICNSTISENIRYLMYKFHMQQWCTGIAIRELCNIRDDIKHSTFATNLKAAIKSTCMN